ncbi:hypothetical protein GWO43_15140 [candidate division KSB1 bacterium]|nr:hypothetical protein [candidate division KSB1 bacterium]NIR73472.1 hypothetical protein [candidate division KSB1 bacterium]NIS25276.1 hypothetical protein [candidate division KSB1 bacterium]NIT72180.1 hypothetical protein [candidate division KSB1 bacterium]NIU25998.1 hypothetical protein [candidate division KSB1 bacterium]
MTSKNTSYHLLRVSLALSLLAFAFSCNEGAPKPAKVYYGEDMCAHCQMLISEPNFVGQFLPANGKVKKFDDIGCLVAKLEEESETPRAIFVASYEDSGWLNAENATFLKSEKLHTPMSFGLAAFPDREAAKEARAEFGGEILSYQQLKQPDLQE